jgi:hypothetical protein
MQNYKEGVPRENISPRRDTWKAAYEREKRH